MKLPTVLVVTLVLKYCTVRAETPCTLEYGGVDLSDAQVLKNGDFSKNGVVYGPNSYVLGDGNKRIGCPCTLKKCMRKCCPDGEYLENSTACDSTMKPFDIPSSSRNPETPSIGTFHIIHGNKCSPLKDRSLLTSEEFILQPDGTLLVTLNNKYYEPIDYCLDYILDEEDVKALICAKPQAATVINVVGMIISMPFLLATFIVYAILPDRNMHAKSLMCYVITLFVAYLLLVNIQYHSMNLDENDSACITMGIFCLFFFMVSFFWINVMSIDIWWTFSGFRGLKGSRRQKDRKRFMLYNGYAWGVPLLIVIIVTCLTINENIDGSVWYNPGLGEGQCWITEGIPTLLYFYGPIALLITCNITLFGITAWKIRQVQEDTAILRKDDNKKQNYENDKQRFYLYLKLMLAMGTNWSMEIISWLVEWQIGPIPFVWYLTDFFNACYGVFIFVIFVCKKNIWMLLKRRYYTLMGKPHLARSLGTQDTSSPRTTTTSSTINHQRVPTVQYSTNNSNVTID